MIHECLCPDCDAECDMDTELCDRCIDYGCFDGESRH